MPDIQYGRSDRSGEGGVLRGRMSQEASEMWDLSHALWTECCLHRKGLGRADTLGLINGNQQVQGGSQQREGGGRRSRKLGMWSWFEPGLQRWTDQGLYLAATFYNRVTAVDNSSALSFHVLYVHGLPPCLVRGIR